MFPHRGPQICRHQPTPGRCRPAGKSGWGRGSGLGGGADPPRARFWLGNDIREEQTKDYPTAQLMRPLAWRRSIKRRKKARPCSLIYFPFFVSLCLCWPFLSYVWSLSYFFNASLLRWSVWLWLFWGRPLGQWIGVFSGNNLEEILRIRLLLRVRRSSPTCVINVRTYVP